MTNCQLSVNVRNDYTGDIITQLIQFCLQQHWFFLKKKWET